jgi:hypothetical protein
MQRGAGELPEHVSGTVLVRLGRAMAAILALDDPDFTANRVCTQVLGRMHFSCAGVGARESAGDAETFDLRRERVRQTYVLQSLALARATAGASA